MAPTPVYGWRVPDLGVAPNGPTGIKNLADDIDATLSSTAQQTYTPVMTADGAAFSLGNGTSQGRYRLWKGWCDLQIFIAFGSTTSGGTGPLRVSLPVQAAGSPQEQWLMCKLYVPSHGNFSGQLFIPALFNVGSPYFPMSTSDNRSGNSRSADSSGTSGTGIPLIPSLYPIQNGGNFCVTGRYRIA